MGHIPKEEKSSRKKDKEKELMKDATEYLNFKTMKKIEKDRYMLDVSLIDSILMDEKLNIDIPNYINGRPTRINSLLIQTSIWLIQKNYMDEGDIHATIIAFE